MVMMDVMRGINYDNKFESSDKNNRFRKAILNEKMLYIFNVFN